mmetsp:Transcript_11597/g.43563  ORF Transcript_11597/g.43563 Transcript_11597/m.43563 type:complete len:732 (-) Transcript_11597:169-2364(-)|eukprot:CAMPEP_0117436560 /NCGR_PEP_ID=MMETSP0759-20121206/1070_1 /TAXON_ID=63605 /ORGANISM="Percolomonas cosmopolitus, Strain WS" /LENGTH=731 /DNA_ID=CAMNT_0005228163 /DNA_START=335 /DNA_END=2530 /DNA_ORIENTATION=-
MSSPSANPKASPDSNSTSTTTNYPQSTALEHLLDALAAKFSNSTYSHQKPLSTTDFLVQMRYSADNREFCKDYCPKVFEKLRALCGIPEQEFHESLLDPNYDILGKNLGKSGSLLFRTADKKYFVKTIDRNEKTFLVSTLPAYYHYLCHNPSSFLLKIFALFRVRLNSLKTVHFIITKNVLPPGLDVCELYDLKGSSAGRLRKEGEFIRKDLDLDRKFVLGAIRNDVQKQIEGDSRYLQSVGVMDYSLLLGVVKKDTGKKRALNPPPLPPKNNRNTQHSLRVKPIARRQSVSLSTISHVLHTSESLLEARATSTITPRRNGHMQTLSLHRNRVFTPPPNITANIPSPPRHNRSSPSSNNGRPSPSHSSPHNISPRYSPSLSPSPRERSLSNGSPSSTTSSLSSSPPVEGRVARLAKQFETLHVDTTRNNSSSRVNTCSPTPPSASHPLPQISPNSSSLSGWKKPPPVIPKKPTKLKGIRPLPITNSSHAHALSAITPNDKEKKYSELKYNPTLLRTLQKQAELSDSSSNLLKTDPENTDGKETKTNPLTQLLNTLSAFTSLNINPVKSKKKNVGSTSQKTQTANSGNANKTSTTSTHNSNNSGNTSRRKVNEHARSTRRYKLQAEPVQTIKTIQPKYVLTSHVSEALLRRKDIWTEGFKLQSKNGSVEEEVFMGVIDITQQFNLRKKSALLVRSLRYDPSLQSSIEPSLYAGRFQRFIDGILVERMEEDEG